MGIMTNYYKLFMFSLWLDIVEKMDLVAFLEETVVPLEVMGAEDIDKRLWIEEPL